MGLFDVISGKRKLKQPAPDRLFAMSTAYVTLQTELELTSRGVAGIVFQALETADFSEILKDTEEVVRATAADTGGQVEDRTDSFGYRWMILRDEDFEDLVVGVNAVGTEVGQLPGVTDVRVDLATGNVTVTSDAVLDDDVVRAAVDEAGYELTGRA